MRAQAVSLMVSLAVLTAVGTREAHAIPLTPFRSEAQAQRYCPSDVVVWLDFAKGIYYGRGQKRYARGFDGSFVCRDEAQQRLSALPAGAAIGL